MMPVINPWWIYLMNVIGKVNSVVFVILLLSSFAFVMIGSAVFLKDDSLDSGDGISVCRFLAKACSALLILHILIPSKDTVLGMMVAKNVTVERAEIRKEVVEKVYNDILEMINKKER
ncbi:MAG: hypothetical protein ACRC0G_08235 [Fusobacteriaceae bacterium]